MATEMAYWVEAFAAKFDNLSLILRVHVVEGERTDSHKLTSDLHVCTTRSACHTPGTPKK